MVAWEGGEKMNCPKCNEPISDNEVLKAAMQMLLNKIIISRASGISKKEFFDTMFQNYGIAFYGSDKQFQEFLSTLQTE